MLHVTNESPRDICYLILRKLNRILNVKFNSSRHSQILQFSIVILFSYYSECGLSFVSIILNETKNI